MNLHDVCGPCIAAVNPPIPVGYQQSIGYTTDASGTRRPVYATPVDRVLQVQAFSEKELAHLQALNIGGILRRVYANGQLASVIRNLEYGGDLLTFNDNLWLVVHVMEQWDTWCSVAVQQQSYDAEGGESGSGNGSIPNFSLMVTPLSTFAFFDADGGLDPGPMILRVQIIPNNGYLYGSSPIAVTLPQFDVDADWTTFSAIVDGVALTSTSSISGYVDENASANFVIALNGIQPGWGAESWQNVVLTAVDGGNHSAISNAFSIPLTKPVAEFSVSPNPVGTGVATQFTDESSQFPTSWLWDFGDSNTSTEQNPSHIYAVGGTYNATLTTSNPGGASAPVHQSVLVSGLYTIVVTPDAQEVHWDSEGNLLNGPIVLTVTINRSPGYVTPINMYFGAALTSWGADFSCTIDGTDINSFSSGYYGLEDAIYLTDVPDSFQIVATGSRQGWGLGNWDVTRGGTNFTGDNADGFVQSNTFNLVHDPFYFVSWYTIYNNISIYAPDVLFDGDGNQLNGTVMINVVPVVIGGYDPTTPISYNLPTDDLDWNDLTGGAPTSWTRPVANGMGFILIGPLSDWAYYFDQITSTDGTDTVTTNYLQITQN